MDALIIELLAEAPTAGVAIYAIWRLSIVMNTLADTIKTVAVSQNDTVSGVVKAEIVENARVSSNVKIAG